MDMEVEAAATVSLVGVSLHCSPVLKVLLLVVMLAYLVQIILIRTWRRKSKCTAPLPLGLVPWPIVGNLPEMFHHGEAGVPVDPPPHEGVGI
jgi:tyrosine N-monooxygenase